LAVRWPELGDSLAAARPLIEEITRTLRKEKPVHDYNLQTMRMVVVDRATRRTHEASAERLARDIRGTARHRTKKVLRAAWSGLADPASVGTRLGLDEAAIRRLESRGHLAKLALPEAEIRRVLYQGHRAYLRTSNGGSTMNVTSIKKRRRTATLIALLLAAATGAGATAGGYEVLGASGSPRHAKPARHGTPVKPASVAWHDNLSDGCLRIRLTYMC